VVDDASKAGSKLSDVASRHGAGLIRSERQLGPGGARNLGARSAATPLVCFLDSDVTLEQSTLEGLLRHFSDPLVAAAAPRIRGPLGQGLRRRFEHDASPLDMGPSPASTRPGSLVSYVPAAVLLVRQELAVELFDEQLQVGEDVDAVWRLVEVGWKVRYEPSLEAAHPARASWTAWLRQRHSYGRSAAQLEQRHGGAAAPLRGSRWALAAWGLVIAGRPLAAAALLAGGIPELRAQLDGVVPKAGEAALLLTVDRAAASAPVVARQLLRSYAPLLLVASLLSRRARRASMGIAALAGLGRWWAAGAGMDPIRFVTLSTVDDLAYCSGLWRGAIELRRTGALRPRLSGSRAGAQAPRARS
jgi:mycofactocin system glycosyltransferase